VRRFLELLLVGFVLLGVDGCGYRPSSHLVDNIFTDSVYVEVVVDRVEPENAPFLKDEMSRIVYQRFKGRVTSKEEAQSHIILSYKGSTFVPLAYEDGYVTRYRTTVRTHFDMVSKEGKLSRDIKSVVDSDIEESSINSSALRIESIGIALRKNLDQFMAYVSAKGMLKENL